MPRCRPTAFLAALLLALSSIPFAAAQPPHSYPVLGKLTRVDPKFDDLIPPNAKLEVLASGFEWTEGPVWVPDETGGHVLFSDIPNNRIVKWQAEQGISVFMKPAGYTGVVPYGNEPGTNGLTLDSQGRLVMCEHGDRRISVLTRDGGKRTLVDNYQGKRLNSPNDLVFHSSGDLYFTDPPYGLPDRFEDARKELDFQGVYRLSADGQLTLLTKSIERPNGIAFSPDEKTLYVAQSHPEQPVWFAFAVQSDGTIGAGKVLCDAKDRVNVHPGVPDGMCVDQQGNLWCSAPGGVMVFTSAGKLLGVIETGERTSNCTFGKDGKLYVTVDMYFCRIQTKSKGIGF